MILQNAPVTGSALDVVVAGIALAARWESVTGTDIDIVVHSPLLALGTPVDLHWRGLRGISTTRGDVVTCEELEPQSSCRLRVRLSGSIEVVQRRQAMRAIGAGPVAVTPIDRRLAPVRSGSLLDIAEEGLRCRLTGGPLLEGQPVAVNVGLGDDLLELQGTVVGETPAAHGSGDVVIAFSAGETDKACIRRFVYLQQVRLRRAGLI